jgi:hypothetical protein
MAKASAIHWRGLSDLRKPLSGPLAGAHLAVAGDPTVADGILDRPVPQRKPSRDARRLDAKKSGKRPGGIERRMAT